MAGRKRTEEQPKPLPVEDPWAKADVRGQIEKRVFDRLDEQEHLDAYVNAVTGLGDWTRDKVMGGSPFGPQFALRFVLSIEAENRWRGSDLGQRIVEAIPDEMTREGWELSVQPSPSDDKEKPPEEPKGKLLRLKRDASPDQGGAPMAAPIEKVPPGPLPEVDEDSSELVEEVDGKLEELGASDAFWEALCYERAYGGGAILIGADDGQEDLATPLDEDRIASVNWLNSFSGGYDGEVVAWSYYRDPRSPKYGMPETYMLRNLGVPISGIVPPGQRAAAPQKVVGSGAMVFWVHESRLLVFPGTAASRRARVQMRGWGDSIFTRVDDVLSQFGQTWAGVANLMQDFSQGVLNIEGLNAALVSGNKTSKGNPITARARQIQMTRSIARMLFLDEKEKFSRETASLAGIAEVLQQFALRLSAAADMPVTLLMGQAPAGLNATGASDVRFFYDRIAAKQKKRLSPQLKRLIRLILKSEDSSSKGKEPGRWNVAFRPLYQMTPLEEAQLRKTVADADHVYVTDGVLSPEEVAASAFGGSEWSMERVIDVEGRQKMKQVSEEKQKDKESIMSEAAKKGVQPDQLAPDHPEHPSKQPLPQSEKEKLFAKKDDEDSTVK